MKSLKRFLFLLAFLPCLVSLTAATPDKNAKPSKSVTEFLAWYAKNHQRINRINLVRNYVNGSGPTGAGYDIDYKAVEQYLTELKKSNYIGPKYVEKWRKYFKDREADFAAQPQKDGLPRGFEHDFVMLSQDFDSELATLDKAEIKSESIQSNNYALVMIKFSSGRVLKYELAKRNDVWLINDISR